MPVAFVRGLDEVSMQECPECGEFELDTEGDGDYWCENCDFRGSGHLEMVWDDDEEEINV